MNGYKLPQVWEHVLLIPGLEFFILPVIAGYDSPATDAAAVAYHFEIGI